LEAANFGDVLDDFGKQAHQTQHLFRRRVIFRLFDTRRSTGIVIVDIIVVVGVDGHHRSHDAPAARRALACESTRIERDDCQSTWRQTISRHETPDC
jgi:hypothetical protein